MTVHDLNREQLIALKQNYLSELNDEGTLNEVIHDKPEWDEDGEHGLSYDELANADSLVPDDVVIDHFRGVDFTEEDF